jgi:DNA-directed RNA polymerase subunit RPC12/RpoP
MTFMHWTPDTLARFKLAHAKALEEGVETFSFEGHDFLPRYAKYLTEYLEGVLVKSKETWADGVWKTPKFSCLNCGKEMDAASDSPLETEPRAPQEGDVSLCAYCSHVMVFTAARTVRSATQAEMDEITANPDTAKLFEAMARVRKAQRRFR